MGLWYWAIIHAFVKVIMKRFVHLGISNKIYSSWTLLLGYNSEIYVPDSGFHVKPGFFRSMSYFIKFTVTANFMVVLLVFNQ